MINLYIAHRAVIRPVEKITILQKAMVSQIQSEIPRRRSEIPKNEKTSSVEPCKENFIRADFDKALKNSVMLTSKFTSSLSGITFEF